MISREDLESFLIRTEMDHREIGESMWLVDPVKDAVEDHPAVVVSLSPPLVIFRASIGTAPEGDHARLKLYQTLLELNATDWKVTRSSWSMPSSSRIWTTRSFRRPWRASLWP